MITKASDFVAEFFIPGVSDIGPNDNSSDGNPVLNRFIEKHEPEALVSLLGYDEYEKLLDELDAAEPDGFKTTTDEKWKRLVNGYKRYKGLKEALVAYIFYKYYEDDSSVYTETGEKVINAKNTDQVSNRPRAIKAWRRYYKLTIGNFAILNAGLFSNPVNVPIIFTSKYGIGFIYSKKTGFTSLYTYVQENQADFEDWEPEYFNNQNVFDI